MNEHATSHLHFIPIGRVIADPMEFPTAQTLAIFGKRAADTDLYQDANGDFALGILNPRTGEREILKPGDDHTGGHEFVIMLVHGGAVIREALQNADLEAFVIDTEGRYLRVPRLYWLKANTATATLEQHDDRLIPDNLVGAPLLVDPAHIDQWIAIVRPPVEAMLTKTRAATGQVIQMPRRRTNKQGRNKTRTGEIDRQIFDMFRRTHDRFAAMTEDTRAAEVAKFWVGPTSPPSKNTVARRWNDWLEKRAGEARDPQ